MGCVTVKYDLCRPCLEELRAEGKKFRLIRGGSNHKVDCVCCKRRRYGASYELVKEKE